ncbi:MAG: DUF2339 domain-containing protein [Acidimicrobiia bacterium]|jgi:uncharacterized membrane protein
MNEAKPNDLLSGRTLFRLGLALVILSVTFLFRYSIQQGWLGPLARVGLAAAAGAVMIGLGLTLSEQRRLYANLLQGGGSAVLYLTAFAAHRQYQMLDTTEAFVQLVAVATVTIVLALKARSELLAGIGLLGAATAPIIVGGRLEAPGGDAAYLAVVGVAATVLLLRMRWLSSYVVAVASITIAVSLEVAWDLIDDVTALASLPPTTPDVIASIALAWALLVGVPLYLAFGPDRGERISTAMPAVTTSFGSPLVYAALYAAFSSEITRPGWALIAAAGAAAHAVAGLGLRRHGREVVARVQIVPTIILGILAMSTGLTGDWILVGMAAISAGAVVGGTRARVRLLADFGHAGMALTFIATAITSAIATDSARTVGDLVPAALVITIIALTGAALWVDASETFETEHVYLVSAFVGTIGWMLAEFPRLGDNGLAAVTAGWAVLGLAAVIAAKIGGSRPALGLGFTTLGIALAKLFLVDLAEASPVARITLFAGIGVALLGVGYWLGDNGVAAHTGADGSERTDPAEQADGLAAVLDQES